jgi:hypothetical protein
MKLFQAFCLLIILSACQESTTPTTTKSSPVKRDSNNTIIQPAKANPYGAIDISPMDISYFPTDYTVIRMSQQTQVAPLARVIYSRPHKQGRKIFGNLLKYGEPWRLGANEATEIEFFQPVTIQNKSVAKGRYIVYCIPEETEWTIIFNNNIYSWGLKQDPGKDIYKFKIPVEKAPSTIEHFTIVFQQAGKDAYMVIAWDDTEARLPIKF